jgi:VCBS repeat-containing protein
LNQDTYLDIVTVNMGNGNLSLLLSTGQGNYAPALSIPVEGIPASLEISDMNMDQLPDLVVGILGQPKVQVIHNDGDGRFPVSRSYGLTRLIFYAHDIAVDDLDNDGDPDIVSVEAGQYTASNQDQTYYNQPIALSASVHSILFNNPERTTQSVSLFGGRKDVEQIQFAEIRMLPPTMAAISNITIDEGSGEHTVSLTGITAGGGESQPLKVTATSGNTNLVPNPTVIYTSPQVTGSLKFTPATDEHGTAIITVTVEDGGPDNDLETVEDNLTTSRTFTVNVTVPNSAPVANDGSLATPDNTDLVRNAQNGLALLVDDVDDDTLTFSVVASPAHGTLSLASDGSFTYTPDTRFNRVDSFTYKANDSIVDSNVATMTITIDTSYAWYNYKNPRDVDADNGIHPVDALYIINAFHSGVATDLPNNRTRPLTKPFYDVDWDSKLTLADAQQIVDWINNPPSGDGEAEGEAFYSSRWEPSSLGQWRTDTTQANSPVLSAQSHIEQLDDACRILQPAAAVLDLLDSRSASQPQLVDQVLEEDLDSLLEDELAELLQ